MFMENFPSTHSYLWVLQQQPVLNIGQEHQSLGDQVFHHVHESSRQPIDRNQTQLRRQRLQHHDDLWS